MTPEMLERIGITIFGYEEWKGGLSNALQVSIRSVRRWASGAAPIPDGLREDLLALLGARRAAAIRMRDIERVAAFSALLSDLTGQEEEKL